MLVCTHCRLLYTHEPSGSGSARLNQIIQSLGITAGSVGRVSLLFPHVHTDRHARARVFKGTARLPKGSPRASEHHAHESEQQGDPPPPGARPPPSSSASVEFLQCQLPASPGSRVFAFRAGELHRNSLGAGGVVMLTSGTCGVGGRRCFCLFPHVRAHARLQ